jgi:hypothetical protein
VGIKKLIIMSSIKDEKYKFTLMDKMLSGEEISADELLVKAKAKNEKTKGTAAKDTPANELPQVESRTTTVDNKILLDNTILITFSSIATPELLQHIEKQVNVFFSKKQ